MNIVETIKKSTLFHSVDMQTIESLAKECHKKTFAKGRDIFAMGDKADAFFIILEGWVKLYRISKDGEEAIIHVFGPGESFAEAAVFNDTKTYPVNAHALDEVILVEIPRSFFIQKIEEDSQFALRMLGAIAARQHYSLHPSFGEAKVLDMSSGIRAAYNDNLPRIIIDGDKRYIRSNGLFRHGYLLSPIMARCIAHYIETGEENEDFLLFSGRYNHAAFHA